AVGLDAVGRARHLAKTPGTPWIGARFGQEPTNCATYPDGGRSILGVGRNSHEMHTCLLSTPTVGAPKARHRGRRRPNDRLSRIPVTGGIEPRIQLAGFRHKSTSVSGGCSAN